MAGLSTAWETLSAPQREQARRIVESFEASWEPHHTNEIDRYLPAKEPLRRAVLLELILVDRELSRRAEVEVGLAHYLDRFKEISAADLEQASQSSSPTPTTRWNETLASSLTQCPYCHSSCAVDSTDSSDSVRCPECNGSFCKEVDATVSQRPETTKRLDKYELLEVVGRGGFGTVYRARDLTLDRIVAVKVPSSGSFSTSDDEDRFVREARSVARLKHPGIVPVYDVGRSEGYPYIVAEFIDGVTLSDFLSGRRLDFQESALLISDLADALQHAHDCGVVHRDIKPANIMLENSGRIANLDADASNSPGSATRSGTKSNSRAGRERSKKQGDTAGSFTTRLMDFGLALREDGEVTVTSDGQVLGTPAYMSPEQARGEGHRVDGRSDVYSLGVILYELLAGELPFRGNLRMLLNQVQHDEPSSPRKMNDRIPRDLETICLKCMDKSVDRRYLSARALGDDLNLYLDDEPILARPIGRIEKAWRWSKHRPALAALVGVIFSSLSVGVLLLSALVILANQKAELELKQKQEMARRASELEEANSRLTVANEAEKRATLRAERNLQAARNVVNDFYVKVSESELVNLPGTEGIRRELLNEAGTYYEHFLKSNDQNANLRIERAAAEFRIAQINVAPDAISALKSAAAVTSGLDMIDEILEDPNQDIDWGSFHDGIYRGLVRQDPSAKGARLPMVAALVMLGTADRACNLWDEIVKRNPSSSGMKNDLAGLYNARGLLRDAAGQPDSAITSFAQAISIWKDLIQQHPNRPRYQSDLALAYSNVAFLHSVRQQYAEAIESCTETLRIQKEIVDAHPESVFLLDLTETERNLAWFYEQAGDRDLAIEHYQQSIEFLTRFINTQNGYTKLLDERRNDVKRLIASGTTTD